MPKCAFRPVAFGAEGGNDIGQLIVGRDIITEISVADAQERIRGILIIGCNFHLLEINLDSACEIIV